MGLPPPSSDEQLTFLFKIQRIFSEGDFTATYKYALLTALADIAVESGVDDGRSLSITNRQIAAQFIELYWRQTTPYSRTAAEAVPDILSQNLGSQAAVVNAIRELRNAHPSATLPRLSQEPYATAYGSLVGKVAATVSAQPLKYLQNFGGSTDEFLYTRSRGSIELLPGIAWCLRRFHPLVQQLARTHWIDHIKGNKLNISALGETDDLEDFLFATPRASLFEIGVGLRLVDDSCFYCRNDLGPKFEVDHFIPWAQYSRDLAHNFVLAHPSCNNSKSDSLAGRQHLTRWLERIDTRSDDLAEIGEQTGIAGNAAASHQIASWAYQNASASQAHAWLRQREYEPIDRAYIELFG